jgi:D-inositol-3-phosphate glycosyltransferase
MNAGMRIGVVTHNYPPHLGGLETIVRELTLGYAKQHHVTVVSTAWDGKTGVSTESGATVHRLPAWHGAEKRGVPYAMPVGPGVRRAITALRSCDVLHAHGSLYATTVLALVARRPGVPLFVTEHVGFVPYSSPRLNAIQRIAWRVIGTPVLRRSTKVIAYNSRVRDWLAGRFREDHVAFITNGVDSVTFRPRTVDERQAARVKLGLPATDVLALFVGRDAHKKNLDAVLEFPANSYRLVVCGAQRTLGADVLNLGAVPHDMMPDVFAAADFLLHAAVGEGFPVTLQEAMASALPVIVLWDDGYAGSLERNAVIAVDSLSELSRAAEHLAECAGMRDEWRGRARAFAERNWSWDVAVERHLALFREAVGWTP